MTVSQNPVAGAAASAGEVTAPHAPAAPLWRVEQRGKVVVFHSTSASAPQPAQWFEHLTAVLETIPQAGLVGAKRLTNDNHVMAMGEYVIHPKGFHSHGRGTDHRCYRFPVEVDAICGGLFIVRQEALEKAGGIAAVQQPLGALELGLSVRQQNLRCIAAPEVVVTDESWPAPTPAQEQAFAARWGFDWRLPDLDDVRQRYRSQGLLWNVHFHGQYLPFEKYDHRPALVWKSYSEHEVFRQRAHHLAQVARKICPPGGRLVDVGCGDGLFSHLYAMEGIEVIGVDPEPHGVEQARAATADKQYPGKAPQFLHGKGGKLPFDDASFETATLLDVIEHLPNPRRILCDIARVLKPGGHVHVCTPSWQFGGSSDAVYHLHEYTKDELVNTLNAIPGLEVAHVGAITGVYRDLIVIAKKAG